MLISALLTHAKCPRAVGKSILEARYFGPQNLVISVHDLSPGIGAFVVISSLNFFTAMSYFGHVMSIPTLTCVHLLLQQIFVNRDNTSFNPRNVRYNSESSLSHVCILS